jgi:hypothetical protein
MRHVLSLIAGVILAPLIYFGAGYGMDDIANHLRTGIHVLSFNEFWLGMVVLLAAGLLYTALLWLPVPPPGTVLAGLIFAGIAAWSMIDAAGFLDTTSKSFLKWHHIGYAATGPTLVVMAVPLIATVFSPRRWKAGAPEAAQAGPAGIAYPGEVSAAPAYTPTTYTPPVYTPLGYASEPAADTHTAAHAAPEPVTTSSEPTTTYTPPSWPTQSGQ